VSLLTHYICYCGPFWKRRTYISQLLFGPFEGRVGLLTECSCCWGPLQSRVGLPAHYSCCWGPLSKQSSLLAHSSCFWGPFEGRVLNYDVVRKILYARIIKFSPNVRNIYARNTLSEAPAVGAQSKCLPCRPLNISLYITVTMEWSYMRIWNRLNMFCFIRYAYFLTWCAHENTVIQSYLYIIEHIEVADEFITSKNADLTRFFTINLTHPDRLKNRPGWKKPSVGALVSGHMRQNAHVGLSLYLLTCIGDLRYKMVLIWTCSVHQEIDKSRHQRGLCMRISASKKPNAHAL